jgi:hypothetical protein
MTARASVGNAGDEEQVGKAKRRQSLGRDRELDDLKAVLGTLQGRRFVWRLLGHCSAFTSVFSADPYIAAHNSGRQDVGHFLMHEVEIAKPDAFLTMMHEHAPPAKADTQQEMDE